mgnify:CR=1 FL=1
MPLSRFFCSRSDHVHCASTHSDLSDRRHHHGERSGEGRRRRGAVDHSLERRAAPNHHDDVILVDGELPLELGELHFESQMRSVGGIDDAQRSVALDGQLLLVGLQTILCDFHHLLFAVLTMKIVVDAFVVVVHLLRPVVLRGDGILVCKVGPLVVGEATIGGVSSSADFTKLSMVSVKLGVEKIGLASG